MLCALLLLHCEKSLPSSAPPRVTLSAPFAAVLANNYAHQNGNKHAMQCNIKCCMPAAHQLRCFPHGYRCHWRKTVGTASYVARGSPRSPGQVHSVSHPRHPMPPSEPYHQPRPALPRTQQQSDTQHCTAASKNV